MLNVDGRIFNEIFALYKVYTEREDDGGVVGNRWLDVRFDD